MTRQRTLTRVALLTALGSMTTSIAGAAELKQVTDWASSSVPPDVSMHAYVPDNVVTNPPLLLLIHFCGGTAGAVFGQARDGGLVSAADQHGFIMVVPSSGRCWDVVSNKARTRDGNGDSHAIRQMVAHALDTYDANSARVYVTGDSSGGMMTELLLALYPEVFKAGSAFAGMPAGCRGSNESGDGGGYSYACAGGTVTHTPEQWGDIARSLAPGHNGGRPRVQLFHGDDDDIITFPNHTEAVKQWSNVLGLDQSPTSSEMVMLGDHQATRERWHDSCGRVALDAFTSLGGDHGPSDALFPAKYVIPFLGLDQPGPLDPHADDCGAGGSAGAGGGGASSGGGGADTGVAGAAAGQTSSGGAGAGGAIAGSMSGGAGGAGQAGALAAGGAVIGNGGATQPSSDANGPAATSNGCSCSVPTRASVSSLFGVLLTLGVLLRRRSSRSSAS